MSKIPYLVRRNNIYYFRFRIPAKYQAFFKAREIVQSLKTEVRTEVMPLAFKLASEVAATLHDLKIGKGDIQIHHFNISNTASKTHQCNIRKCTTILNIRRIGLNKLF